MSPNVSNMSNSLVILVLFGAFFGWMRYGSVSHNYKKGQWQLKCLEYWNGFVSYSLAGLMGYYFILYRWPHLKEGQILTPSAFALFIVFAFSIFGHLAVAVRNITEGIEAILKKVIQR